MTFALLMAVSNLVTSETDAVSETASVWGRKSTQNSPQNGTRPPCGPTDHLIKWRFRHASAQRRLVMEPGQHPYHTVLARIGDDC
jgi:hypothetical protein